VRYEQVNAMLLNEFLKSTAGSINSRNKLKRLTAGFQKISAQLQVIDLLPQTVVNAR
jgi:hypothetical protein